MFNCAIPCSLEQGPRSAGEETKGRKETELSEQIKILDFQNGRGWSSSNSNSLNAFPGFRRRGRGGASFLYFCVLQLELERKRGGQWSLGMSSLSTPKKVTEAAGEKSAASRADTVGGQRWRPPGQGAELARTEAGMARQPDLRHSAELTAGLVLTSVPRWLTCPTVGSDAAAARTAALPSPAPGKSPVSERCLACSQRPQPRSFLWSN